MTREARSLRRSAGLPATSCLARRRSDALRRIPVTAERFEADRSATWAELEALLERAGDRPERAGADGVRRLGELYRAAAADLAFARRRYPGDPVLARLESLVLRSRSSVYARSGRRASLWSFLSRGYWRRLAERPALVFAAWALLLLP